MRQYEDLVNAKGGNFDLGNYDVVAIHDQRPVMLTYLKDDTYCWRRCEINARQHFLAKVPKNAEVAVHYEVEAPGCGSSYFAGYLVVQKGIALVPKKKSETTEI